MPSSYLGCQISDENLEALNEFSRSLEAARVDAEAATADLDTAITELSLPANKASLTVGDVASDNQITWTAVAEGDEGNQVRIFYDYRGPVPNPAQPSGFDPRPPSSYVDATSGIVHFMLPIDATGQIDPAFPVNLCLPIWASSIDVQAQVTGVLIGAGTGLPQPTGVLRLGGGRTSVLPDAEAGANDVAKAFGKQSYTSLLRSVGVPVMETAADAASYIESIDSETVIVNGKIFVVSGTNLTGINVLYQKLGNSVTALREKLSLVAKTTKMPYLLSTENVSQLTYDLVCSVPVPVTMVVETYRTWDTRISATAATYVGGNGAALNHYIFWSVGVDPSSMSQQKLVALEMPPLYWPTIMVSTTVELTIATVPPPQVYTIEDPDLLSKLHLTDAEIAELLNKNINGVKLPGATSVSDLAKRVNKILGNTRSRLPNGMRHKVKAPIAASKVFDLGASFNDTSRLQEMAIRGRACARLPSNFPNIPSIKLPTIPSTSLPDAAAKIESLFAVLSSAVQRALEMFDRLFNAVKKMIDSFLNKMQNLNSLSDNLFKNDLAKCLLGMGSMATGVPDPSKVGPGAGWGSGGVNGGTMPSQGGVSLPSSVFATLMQKLSSKLEETVSKAFTAVMRAIQVPLCLAMSVLTAMQVLDLGSKLAPCKDALDPNNKCPPEDVQNTINDSPEMSAATSTMTQLENTPKTSSVSEVKEQVQNFTGQVQKSVETTTQSVTRGIKQIVDEVSLSISIKLQYVDKVMLAIRQMIQDAMQGKMTGPSEAQKQGACAPPSVGMMTDRITAIL